VKVLVVEDGVKVSRFLARVLSEEGFTADICTRGDDAIRQAATGLYSLVLLDWMLPDIDGLTVCREIRRFGVWVPILMLTARGEVRERVLGLSSGADDYLVKPFEVDELVARVHALVRRAQGFAQLRCGALEIDRVAHVARVEGVTIDLTTREYAVLAHLARHNEQIVTRSDLLAQVWDTTFESGSNIVEVQISRLRDKLGAHAWMIETVRGFGYRMRARRSS
jgi:DNA-binding response OmpR family regulator